jgi:hypothetical protein
LEGVGTLYKTKLSTLEIGLKFVLSRRVLARYIALDVGLKFVLSWRVLARYKDLDIGPFGTPRNVSRDRH